MVYNDLIDINLLGRFWDKAKQHMPGGEGSQVPLVESVSGSVASFARFIEGVPINKLLVDIYPVLSGSGDPSPTNIREIGGVAGTTLTASSKNLLGVWCNEQYYANGVAFVVQRDINGNVIGIAVNGTATASTTLDINDTSNAGAELVKLKAGEKYILSGCPEGGGASKFRLYRKGYGAEYYDEGNGVEFPVDNADSDCSIRIVVYNGYTAKDLMFRPMLRLAGTTPVFEPHRGKRQDISWSNEAGTVYRGNYNPNTGLLAVTHKLIALGSLTWSYITSYANPFFYADTADGKKFVNIPAPMDFYCSAYKPQKWSVNGTNFGATSDNDKTIAINDRGVAYSTRLFLMDSGYTSAASFNAAMQSDATKTVLYPLEEPLTYQLTPSEFVSYFGENSVYATGCQVSVSVGSDIKDYVDSVVLGAIGGGY